MLKIKLGACELDVKYHEEQPAIFIDPKIPENIEIVSGIKFNRKMSDAECRFHEKHHQEMLLKSYKEKESENAKA